MSEKKTTDDRTILLEAFLDGVNPLKDGSMSLRFHTQQLGVEDKVIIMEFLTAQGWLAFKENVIQADELPQYDAEFDEFKTPSQRFRATLYRLWEATGQDEEFNDFYKKLLEKLITHYKDKIPKQA